MVYIYALSEATSDAPAVCGLDGTALRVVSTEELTAVVSDRAAAPLHVCESALWAHERVVEALMLDRAVLPMRFGSVERDDGAVRRMLTARQQELIVALARVSGAVELGVRAALQPEVTTGAEPAAAARGAGTAYLMRRSGSHRRARALAERLDCSLAELCRTRVQRLPASPSPSVSAAYLVDRGGVDAFRGQVATLDAEVEDAQIVCTGPWPPYSFTEARAS